MALYFHHHELSEMIEDTLDTIKFSSKLAAINRLGLSIHEFSPPSSKYGSFKEKNIFSHGPRAASDHILEFILSGFPNWNGQQEYLNWEEGIALFAATAIESIRLGCENTGQIHAPIDLQTKEVLEEVVECAKKSVHSWKEGLISSDT